MGIAAGVLAATRPRSLADRAVTGLALVFYSMPTFLLGQLLLYFLFFRLTLAGIESSRRAATCRSRENPLAVGAAPDPAVADDRARHRRHLLAPHARRDARRARRGLHPHRPRQGVTERRVIYRHALRSALTPVVTQFGIDLGTLLGGAIVTEQVFGLPGSAASRAGRRQQDLPMIIGTVLLASAFIVVASVLVDLVYWRSRPRVRAH